MGSWFDPEPGRAASIGPSRRPLTNQTPAIVVDAAGPRLVVGASGGQRILDAVAQLVIKVVDLAWGLATIGNPRMDCSEQRLLVDDQVSVETLAGLARFGHAVEGVQNRLLPGRLRESRWKSAYDRAARSCAAVPTSCTRRWRWGCRPPHRRAGGDCPAGVGDYCQQWKDR